jgi:acyl-lipid omega-6 desaturase (Delta-12 desaturase)
MKNTFNKYQNYSLVKAASEFASSILLISSGYALTTFHDENLLKCIALNFIGVVFSGMGVVKIFTIQHDCGHKSFTNISIVDDLIGKFCSLFTLIPFTAWKIEHGSHHAAFCSIEKRTLGDVYVMSTDEFKKATKTKQYLYTAFRSKFFVLGIAPLAFLLLRCRVAVKGNRKQKNSAYLTNIVLFVVYFLAIKYELLSLLNLLAIWHVAGTVAMILFYNEHQYEKAEWKQEINWSYNHACTHASSVIDFPKLISWLTGNIGYHHIHHINPRIPSYNIRNAYFETKNQIPHHVIKPSELLFPIGFLLWSNSKNKFVKSF